MYTPLLYALLSAACFYLGSRALVTRWLWSRYPPSLASFMDCSACTGFWWGFALAAIVGQCLHLPYMGLDPSSPLTWCIVGLCSIVLTPIAAGLMQHGLDQLGHIEPDSEPPVEKTRWTRIV